MAAADPAYGVGRPLERGLTKLATIKPTALINLFGTPALKEVAREVETTLKAIMAEAAIAWGSRSA